MIAHKLMNILLSVDDHAAEHPELYFRAHEGDAVVSCDGRPFRANGPVGFTTYLNALPAVKWCRYTGIEVAYLHLELSGAGAIELQSVASGASEFHVTTRREIDASGVSAMDIEVPLAGADLIGFSLIPARGSNLELHRAWYYARVEEADVNEIRLALSTTTFNNERYILPNIELVKKSIEAEGDPIASNFHMFVVDNGRTLDVDSISCDAVTVVPNPNTGGSGGFARGMIAATEKPGEFTHVLLMDDDVRILPESILRTFNLLSLARGGYRHAFLNGAMLSLENPVRQFEDVAFVDPSGVYRRVKEDLYMDRLADVLENERIDVEVDQAYGAWWFSCIPVEAIEENGLPLPLFIRIDDVEFGIRNEPRYMAMGGICVWHSSFEGRFRASVDCYQYTRNFHIMTALHGCSSERMAVVRLWRNVRQNLRDMDYSAAELLLDGFEDYLKGPSFLEHANGAELMKSNGARNERQVPISDIDPSLLREAGVNEHVLSRTDVSVKPPSWLKAWRAVPYDKHYVPDCLLSEKACYLVKYGPGTIEGSSIGHKVIVCLDPTRTQAAVRRMDRERFRAIRRREKELIRRWRKEGDRVREAYRAARKYLTSREFWMAYLDEMSH